MGGKMILNGKEYMGGKSAPYKEVTLSEYNALPASKLTNGIAYYIKDLGNPYSYPPLIYSDEEREIGVWRDGRPVYEKTVTFGAISGGAQFSIQSGVTTVDTLVNVDVMCSISGGFIKMPMALPASSSVVEEWCAGLQSFSKSTGNLRLDTGTNRSFDGGFAVFRYTKTTDTPGSGIWTTQGGFARHYSTTEHAIGTWIDGKPIYEKTVHFIKTDCIKENDYDYRLDFNRTAFSIKDIIDIKGILKMLVTNWGTIEIKFNGRAYCLNDNTKDRWIDWTNYYQSSAIKSQKASEGYGFNLNSETSDWDGYYTIQYTKTTD